MEDSRDDLAVLLISRFGFHQVLDYLLAFFFFLVDAAVDDRYDCYVSRKRLFKNDI